jgi:hypothetical protein
MIHYFCINSYWGFICFVIAVSILFVQFLVCLSKYEKKQYILRTLSKTAGRIWPLREKKWPVKRLGSFSMTQKQTSQQQSTNRTSLQWRSPESARLKKHKGQNYPDLFLISKVLSVTNLFLWNKQSLKHSTLNFTTFMTANASKQAKYLAGQIDFALLQCTFSHSTFGKAVFGQQSNTCCVTHHTYLICLVCLFHVLIYWKHL